MVVQVVNVVQVVRVARVVRVVQVGKFVNVYEQDQVNNANSAFIFMIL